VETRVLPVVGTALIASAAVAITGRTTSHMKDVPEPVGPAKPASADSLALPHIVLTKAIIMELLIITVLELM